MTTNLTPAQKAAATRKARRAAQGSLDLPARANLAGLCIRLGDTWRDATRDEILEAAAAYLIPETRGNTCSSPQEAAAMFRPIVCGRPQESFAVAFLDCRHRVLGIETLFKGTIDGATVYARELVRRALEIGASAVMISHNHPSGVAEPSEADRHITLKLAKALAVVEIRLLDHVICTNGGYVSMAERGLV